MTVRSVSNVVPFRRGRTGGPFARDFSTTVMHAIARDEDLPEIASVVHALSRREAFRQVIVHAGRPAHDDLAGLMGFDHKLGIGTGTAGERTAAALVAFEALMGAERPDLLVTVGDDDLVVAAAMAAVKQHVAVVHLGSGLRSHDWSLPDEVNRTLIDRLSDLLFTRSEDASANLADEGVPEGRVQLIGNTRVDVLRRSEPRARALAAWAEHGAEPHAYTLVLVERPETIELAGGPEPFAGALAGIATAGPVLLVQQPATREALETEAAQALLAAAGVRSLSPTGFLHTLSLQLGAGAILTDAGTVQEDASALGVRCFTLQAGTAHTTTLTHGTNVLLGADAVSISSVRPTGCAPTPAAVPLWDGRAGERAADALAANYTLAAASGRDR